MIGVKPRNARVAAALAASGIEPDIKILHADAKTAAAAAEQLGCDVGAIANSLIFDCDGNPLLVMAWCASGRYRPVDASPGRDLDHQSGCRAGAASHRPGDRGSGADRPSDPAAHLVDETLARHPVVWTAAGTPDSVMPLSYEQLLTITEGIAMQVR